MVYWSYPLSFIAEVVEYLEEEALKYLLFMLLFKIECEQTKERGENDGGMNKVYRFIIIIINDPIHFCTEKECVPCIADATLLRIAVYNTTIVSAA